MGSPQNRFLARVASNKPLAQEIPVPAPQPETQNRFLQRSATGGQPGPEEDSGGILGTLARGARAVGHAVAHPIQTVTPVVESAVRGITHPIDTSKQIGARFVQGAADVGAAFEGAAAGIDRLLGADPTRSATRQANFKARGQLLQDLVPLPESGVGRFAAEAVRQTPALIGGEALLGGALALAPAKVRALLATARAAEGAGLGERIGVAAANTAKRAVRGVGEGAAYGAVSGEDPVESAEAFGILNPLLGLPGEALGVARGAAKAAEGRGLGQRIADMVDPGRAEKLRTAYTDPLTGLNNQTAFQQALPRIDADATREVLTIDAVGLKAHNDKLGREAGDAFLARIGTAVKEAAEQAGVSPRDVFRAGGDEFAIAVPKGQAEALGRAIKEAVGETPIGKSGKVAAARYGVGDTYAAADAAAQAAKKLEGSAYARLGEEAVPSEQLDLLAESPVPRAPTSPEAGFAVLPAKPTVEAPIPGDVPAPRPAVIDKIGSVIGREFRVRGNLPQPVFDAKLVKNANRAAQETVIRNTSRDLEAAVRASTGRSYKGLSEPEVTRINSVLSGEATPESLPEAMRLVVQNMRSQIDAHSAQMIRDELVEGPLAAKVEGNLGTYLNRTYQVFTDPKWAERVPETIRNKAKAFIRAEHPDASPQEIDGLISELLYRGQEAGSGPMEALAQGNLSARARSILTKREEVPAAIRALWGESKDPLVNYANSVAKMSAVIEHGKFLRAVREGGEGLFLHEKPTGQFYAKIDVGGGAPLYTTPEIAVAWKSATSPQVMGPVMRAYTRLNLGVKLGKTVGSVVSQIRNFISNPMIELANGNLNIFQAGKAARAVAGNLSAPTEAIAERLSQIAGSERNWREYWLNLQRRGVVGQSSNAGEIRDMLIDASTRPGKIVDAFADPLSSRLKKGFQVAENIYSGNDDFFKVIGFESEFARYRNALDRYNTAHGLPLVSDDALADRIAKLVTDTRPTYAKVPEITKKLRRVLLVGNFVSWPSEIIRTTYNVGKTAFAELADPALRGIGAQRLAGLAAVAGVVPAVAAYSRFASGVTKDEENDLRAFLPPWQQNSNLLHLGRDAKGNYSYTDLSYVDPYSYLRKPILAMMRGEDALDAFKDAAVEVAEPFLSEEILASTLMNVRSNQRERGNDSRIYNPQDDPQKQLADISAYVWSKVEPGTLTTARRIKMGSTGEMTQTGQTYDAKAETRAALTGQRVGKVNPSQALYYRLRDLNDQVSDENRRFTSSLTNLGSVAPGTIKETYQSISQGRMELFQKAAEAAHAARRLGVSDAAIVASFKQAGFTEKETESIAHGRVPFYSPSEQLAKSFRARLQRAGTSAPEIDSIISARGGAMREERQRLLPSP